MATVEITPGADTLTALGATRGFTAVAKDANGDEVTGVTFTWSSSDTGVATVDEEGVVTAAANGSADITAVADGVAGTAALAVIQQAETVTVSPASATLSTIGVTHQFTATATDANGNPVEGAAFLWRSEDPTVATVDSAGLATSRGAGQTTVTASAQGVPGHASLMVIQEINRLAFRTQPTSATAGEAIDPAVQVEVLDAAGNLVADAEIAITLALAANPYGATLGGTRTVNATAGVATFSGLWVDVAAADYALAATSPGLAEVPSAAFDIAAGPAAQLAFVTQPADATAGKAISPAVDVQVQDAFGNPVTGATDEVSVSIAANPGGGTLSGTVTVAASGGAAAFSDLWIDRAAAGYRLAAHASSLAGDVSAAFPVWPGEPIQLGFVTEPSSAEGQEPIGPTVQVAVQDAFGNTVPTASADVAVALQSNNTGAELSGTLAASTVDGVATFADLAVALPAAGYSLLASAVDLDPVESELFTIALTFAQLSVGAWHTCGTTVAGHPYCWGNDESSRLGSAVGTGPYSATPVPVATTDSFALVVAGGSHSCGMTTGYEPFCWGDNGAGQLGDGTTLTRTTPVPVANLTAVVTVIAGRDHSCGMSFASRIYCWGNNSYGQLGDGTTTNRTSPVAVDVSALSTQSFSWMSGGPVHTCGVTTADEPFCWGRNAFGTLGDGTTTNRTTPVAVDVSGLSTQSFTRISADGEHTCGRTTADEPICWGLNVLGQVGDGTTTDRTTPVPVDVSGLATQTFGRVSAGTGHTCGLTTADEAYCWGRNGDGQLGDGTNTGRTTPTAVSTTLSFTSISSGQRHSCGLTAGGDVFCWGDNTYGQLGDGTTTDRSTPVRVVQ